MAGYEGSLLNKPFEWFLVCFEKFSLEIVRELFVVSFSAMIVHQMLEEW